MIDTFFKDRDIYKQKNVFGEFLYDIDVNSNLPLKIDFNRELAKEALYLIDEVFKSVNLDYFLIFGTALGAVRDKNFIKYDEDIDLGIFKKDKILLIKALKTLMKKYDFIISKISTLNESITIYYRNQIIIDIGLFKKDKNYYIYNNFRENRIPSRFLDTLEKIEFLNREILAPSDIENYLLYLYGKRWREPKKDWHFLNRYINLDFKLLSKQKSRFIKFKHHLIDKKYLFMFKFLGLYSDVLHSLNMKNIKNIKKSGEGFCDTFIIYGDKNIIFKVHNQKRFEYLQSNYKQYEPIYNFLDYQQRFKFEKDIFEKLNEKNVYILDDIIVFPFIKSKSLSSFLGSDKFYIYLKETFDYLKKHKISHGDLHIDNILVNNRIYLIDFEMLFSNYLSYNEKFYYDVYYLFAKLEYYYPKFFYNSIPNLKKFIQSYFNRYDRDAIIAVSKKCKRYFFTINGAKIELFQ